MQKAVGSHNYPTFGMTYYGYQLNHEAGRPTLSRHEFYVRCAQDEEFKATWAPHLDLEYVESYELQEDAQPLVS